MHRRAIAAWQSLPAEQQDLWESYSLGVEPHRPPFDHTTRISGYNLFVSAYHGFATLGNEYVPRVPSRALPVVGQNPAHGAGQRSQPRPDAQPPGLALRCCKHRHGYHTKRCLPARVPGTRPLRVARYRDRLPIPVPAAVVSYEVIRFPRRQPVLLLEQDFPVAAAIGANMNNDSHLLQHIQVVLDSILGSPGDLG